MLSVNSLVRYPTEQLSYELVCYVMVMSAGEKEARSPWFLSSSGW